MWILVGVEGHWTLIENTMFKCSEIPSFEVVWPRAASMPSGKFSGFTLPEAGRKGPDSLGQSHWASPFFSPVSLCVSGTRPWGPLWGREAGLLPRLFPA